MENLIAALKNHNCKITPQRLAVYDVLKENHEHPNAEHVYNLLAPQYPTISLATVYKSLELFADLGLIQVINVGENSFRYDCNSTNHAHVVCTKCHKVEDLTNPAFDSLASKAEEMVDYQIYKQQLCFYGICEACKSTQKKEARKESLA